MNAVSAFVGAFAAIVSLELFSGQPRWVRYLAAFVCGLLIAVALDWFVGIVAGAFARIGG